MRNRIQPWFAVVLAFMAIGVITRMMQGSIDSWAIPLGLAAIVFLLYKFPPDRWRKPKQRSRPPVKKPPRPDFRSASSKTERRRASPFTVIEGRKDRDDEPPRYH
ncbi:hypothetical protein B1A99_34590 [Cohnella sp. CIP 111063]|uniref:hypothetical protein n=1 Tax=unclassified Cohnella TaxID=2636738 RepID=UPI000B9D1775|nr:MULTISPECIES: hypothetical protein [unclassified Cohnella]OXS52252.1 hypothetical protein B1A99_34590 [Cohnella sp. CIP 111063]PRX55754.1 hypothetical protein B0G52_1396 [Cohnella sp. SGD-V74]